MKLVCWTCVLSYSNVYTYFALYFRFAADSVLVKPCRCHMDYKQQQHLELLWTDLTDSNCDGYILYLVSWHEEHPHLHWTSLYSIFKQIWKSDEYYRTLSYRFFAVTTMRIPTTNVNYPIHPNHMYCVEYEVIEELVHCLSTTCFNRTYHGQSHSLHNFLPTISRMASRFYYPFIANTIVPYTNCSVNRCYIAAISPVDWCWSVPRKR